MILQQFELFGRTEYAGDVGEYCGEVGLYWGEVGLYLQLTK